MLALHNLSDMDEKEIIEHIKERYNEHEHLSSCTIIIADEENEYECSNSYFLYIHNGKLYENHASHCSCYGYEGQFEPEDTDLQFINSRHYNVAFTNKETVVNYINSFMEKYNMENDYMEFDANKAKEIIEKNNKEQIRPIIEKIKEACQHNEKKIHVYEPLTIIILNHLKEKGFEVEHHPNIDVVKSGLYYTISWG